MIWKFEYALWLYMTLLHAYRVFFFRLSTISNCGMSDKSVAHHCKLEVYTICTGLYCHDNLHNLQLAAMDFSNNPAVWLNEHAARYPSPSLCWWFRKTLLILMSVWAANLHIPMVSMVMSYWKLSVCISIDLDVFKDTNASTELDRQRVVSWEFLTEVFVNFHILAAIMLHSLTSNMTY